MIAGMYSYETYVSAKSKETKDNSTKTRGNVGYFKLVDDGDEAIVRFVYDDKSELVMAHVHDEPVGNNKHRRVLCLRSDARDDMAKCPLCARGDKFFAKVYLKLIEYVKDEQGKIIPQAKIWERPESFAEQIVEYIDNYGGIKDVVFKVKRSGARGNTDTNYILTPMPNTVYTEANGYVKDFHDFDNFSFYPHSFISKNKEDMEEYIKTGEFPFHKKDGSPSTTTPTTNTSTPVVEKVVTKEEPKVEVTPTPEVPSRPLTSGVHTTDTTGTLITTINTQSGDTNNPLTDRPRRRYDYK